MSFKPVPPMRGMSGGGFRLNNEDSASVRSSEDSSTSTKTASKTDDIVRKVWTEAQWVNLSRQAKDLGLPTLSFFDPATMLLSKEVNWKLWNQLVRLACVARHFCETCTLYETDTVAA
jgi:hypothetical protein